MSKPKKPKSAVNQSLPDPLLLDVRGAAHVLSSSVWTVRGLLWRDEIPHIKIGRKFLIDPADLRAFIQRKKVTS